ncbi:CRISPR-associated endoribonuclease Cas6 [Clostridium sp. ZS2-4]|uniref:CRISPR-associated endoribonuclease Cas6 n=1 Tax=Clostridium sp. ZS2-4 TaxID=2987703 RepID=UPI00227C7DA7|nr:CRISPR-associated endoribonuclease Cas6 [Clostridium sp. ZS2-4]MCY6354759.1 CRISPR-associated endoribonuclease Cas6 [Clostridium sp. ZS2-4]
MRMSVEYKTDKFPLAYQMMGVSLIKEAIKEVDEDYYKNLYTYQENKSNKQTKNFCFSFFMKDFEKQGDVFIIKDRVIFNISSPDYTFMVNLYNGLIKLDTFKYKDFNLNKVRINLVKEKSISNNVITFNTLSPIFIQDKNHKALEINNERYEKELNYIVNETLKNYRGYGLKEELKFIPSRNMKKRVVKEDIRAFRQKADKPYYYVNSYVGMFQLQGDVNDLNDIYKLGVGFKRGQGFGMLEIVG